LCVVSAIALPRAHATVWQQTIEAPNIYIETLHLDTDEEVIYATNGLSSGTDTVMHLLRITSTGVDQVAYNDNYSGSLRSRIAYTNTASPADFLLVIRAKSELTWGVADLIRICPPELEECDFPDVWQPDIPIQGTFLDYAEVDADPDDTLYAVHVPPRLRRVRRRRGG
jgi:hypothetical protein